MSAAFSLASLVRRHLAVVACALCAACSEVPLREVRPDAPLLPPAALERRSATVGVHFPAALRDAQSDERIEIDGMTMRWRHYIGGPATDVIRQAIRAVFEEVIEVPVWPAPAGSHPDAVAVLVPTPPVIESSLNSAATVNLFRRTIALTLVWHGADGSHENVSVTGNVVTGAHAPLFMSDRTLDEHALRNVGAALTAALQDHARGSFPPPAPRPAVAKAPARGVVAVRLDAGAARDDGIEQRIASCLGQAISPPTALRGEQPAAALRDALFPWLDPGVAPRSTDNVRALLERPSVRARLDQMDVGTLILFTARDADRSRKENLFCAAAIGGGGCFGYYEQRSGYVVDLAVWEVATRAPVSTGHVDVMTTFGVVGLLVPVPFFSTSAADACVQMQAFIKATLARAP